MGNNDGRINHNSDSISVNDTRTNSSSDTVSPIDSSRYDDNMFRIFISHKHKDKLQAKKIKKELEDAAGRIQIFLSQDIEAGEDWPEKIMKELERADWLILLYTDPTEEWDWCLFETGFFQGVARSKKCNSRLISLHSAASPPKPLKNWQSINMVKDEVVERFLVPLFTESPREGCEPLNERFNKETPWGKTLADNIISAVGEKPSWKRYTRYLILILDEVQVEELDETIRVPVDTRVESDKESLALFGLTDESWTWNKIMNKLKGKSQAWTIPLGHAMWNANKGNVNNGGLPVMRAPGDGKEYRPILYSYGRMSDKSRLFKIILNELPTDDNPMPFDDTKESRDLAIILDLLLQARRIRWGVIEKFYQRISDLIEDEVNDEDEISKCLDDFKWSFEHFMIESNHNSRYQKKNVIPLFKDDVKDKEIVESCSEGIIKAKRVIDEILEGSDSSSEQALGILKEIQIVLKGARMPNNDFMVVGMKKCQEMFEDLGKEIEKEG